jgi:hypothetical protein
MTEKRNVYILLGKLNVIYYLKNLGAEEMYFMIFMKQGVRVGTRFKWPRIGTSGIFLRTRI